MEQPSSKSGSVVLLCIQSESGKRWQEEMSDATTLWEAIERSGFMKDVPDQDENNAVPVIVFMAKEIIGEESLRQTTLRSLGLTSGRALVRLIIRNPEVLKGQAMSGHISARNDKQSKTESLSPPRRAMRVDDGRSYLEKLKDEMKSDETQKEVDQKPVVEEPTAISKGEPEPEKDIDSLPPRTPIPTSDSKDEPMDTESSQRDREVVEEEPILHYIGENNAVVFVSDDIPRVQRVTAADESDAFYDLTESDVRKLYQERVRAVKDAEEGSELLTSAMKEARMEAKKLSTLSTYRKTVVRVQFPNHVVVQATFLSGQTVGEVMSFLRKRSCTRLR